MEERIGITAGKVWHLLSERGELALTNIVKEIDEPPSMVYMAIGWLAREGKLEFMASRRGRGQRVVLKG
ncbi:MAG TPA: hypothetical protein ENG09_03805 [Candidatus Syntrophoarchaeum butanivorans]|nr:MAG: hypothetical protein CW694_05215 [Candidatus Syntrophoarchaeum sp. WYZ-LMO15]HDM36364.1 hypothetical protein [Candidatus Syntrophoarchaeum butanivorans]